MAEPIFDQPTTLGNDYVQTITTDAALYADAYDIPSRTPTENSEPTFAEESAFRIIKDLKTIDDARRDQEAFLNVGVLGGSAGAALVGLVTEIPTLGASTALVVGGVSTFVYSIARGLKDGADWKNASDDMNSVLDELLDRQKEGELSAHDIERFATLMHNLPADSLKDIFDAGQLAKYQELVASAAE